MENISEVSLYEVFSLTKTSNNRSFKRKLLNPSKYMLEVVYTTPSTFVKPAFRYNKNNKVVTIELPIEAPSGKAIQVKITDGRESLIKKTWKEISRDTLKWLVGSILAVCFFSILFWAIDKYTDWGVPIKKQASKLTAVSVSERFEGKEGCNEEEGERGVLIENSFTCLGDGYLIETEVHEERLTYEQAEDRCDALDAELPDIFTLKRTIEKDPDVEYNKRYPEWAKNLKILNKRAQNIPNTSIDAKGNVTGTEDETRVYSRCLIEQ